MHAGRLNKSQPLQRHLRAAATTAEPTVWNFGYGCATWDNSKNRQNLEILTEGDPVLFNPYGSILVNPAKWPKVKFADAKIWHEWLTAKPGLDAITSFKTNDEEVFFPPRLEVIHSGC
jgi:hypothetical protein